MFLNLFRKKEVFVNPNEQFVKWESDGRPLPPPHIVKQKTVDEFRTRFNTAILVETGTYLGEMVEVQRNHFSKIYSIELSRRLYKKALKRFKQYPHIEILQGDSGVVLGTLIKKLEYPTLFWLDGHYSQGMTAKGDKECPVIEELSAILSSSLNHVILIDDARMFNGTHDYPTISEIKEVFEKKSRDFSLEIQNDIIQIILKQSK